jgi:hypothetical protein
MHRSHSLPPEITHTCERADQPISKSVARFFVRAISFCRKEHVASSQTTSTNLFSEKGEGKEVILSLLFLMDRVLTVCQLRAFDVQQSEAAAPRLFSELQPRFTPIGHQRSNQARGQRDALLREDGKSHLGWIAQRLA